MKKESKSVSKRIGMLALAGLASLVIGGCASSPKDIPTKEIKPKTELIAPAPVNPTMGMIYLEGKSLNDYFKDFNDLSPEQQETSVKALNNLSAWETVLLSRYVPIDGTLGKLSSFYSTDYKGYLESILSASVLDPTALGGTAEKGLGQLSSTSEKWARGLYNNKKLAYKFPGQEITGDLSDPYTNLVLSSILFRKAAEEKVKDLDALTSLYSNGFKGVTAEDGLYTANETGLNAVNRAKTFESIADKMMIFSWVSMNRPDLIRYIDNPDLKSIMEANKDSYDANKPAYEGMIGFLKSTSTNKKYSAETKKIFENEATNIPKWIKNLHNK
jgi:hypothetical protein